MRTVMMGLLTAATLFVTGCASGSASGDDEPARAGEQPGDVVDSARQQLGDSFAGGFLAGGDVVVQTTDPAARDAITALGARPRVVEHSMTALQGWDVRVGDALGPAPPAAVTTWGVDVQRNAVVVSVLPGDPVPPQLQQIVDTAGGAVVLAEAPGPVVPLPAPGN